MKPLCLISLPNELLTEILLSLPPSDVINCRKVCRHLRRLARNHTLWLEVLSRCTYVLPDIDLSWSTRTLEEVLLRAERITGVWTQARSIPHAIAEYTFGSSTYFVGLIGPYIVIDEWDVEVKWSLYSPDDVENPVFEFTPRHDLSYTTIHDRMVKVHPDINEVHIVYSFTEDFPDQERNCINIVVLKLESYTKFQDRLTTFVIEDRALFSEIDVISSQELIFGPDYVAICPSSRPIHLFHIATGKIVLCPYHVDQEEGPYDTISDIQCFMTPNYFIQFHRAGRLGFYSLPPLSILTETSTTLRAELTHSVLLPYSWWPEALLARTGSSFFAYGHTPSGFRFMKMDLITSEKEPGAVNFTDHDLPLTFEGINPYDDLSIIESAAQASRSSKSTLILSEEWGSPTSANFREGHNFFALGIHIRLDNLFSNHPGGLIFDTVSTVTPLQIKFDLDLKCRQVSCVWFDQIAGRLVMNLEEIGSKPMRIAIVDLVPP